MSIEYINAAFKAKIKSSSEKFVLVALADYANEVGEAYPSVQTLENKTSLNRKTILASLKNLAAIGVLLDTGMKRGKTKQITVYKIVMHKLAELRITITTDESETVPKTGRYQKLNSTENGTGKDTENGTVMAGKESQKRDTEPSVLFNHQVEPLESNGSGEKQTQPEPPKPATQAARKQKHDVKKMTAAFENLFAEYPAVKNNKPAAAAEWKKLWIERGDERMEGGVVRIMQDIHDRASHARGKYSPFWQTSLTTYIKGRMWNDDQPQIWKDKVAPQIANEYRLPDRLKAPVSDVYDDTLDDIPF